MWENTGNKEGRKTSLHSCKGKKDYLIYTQLDKEEKSGIMFNIELYKCNRCGVMGFPSYKGNYCTMCANEIHHGVYNPFVTKETREKEAKEWYFIMRKKELTRTLTNLFGE